MNVNRPTSNILTMDMDYLDFHTLMAAREVLNRFTEIMVYSKAGHLVDESTGQVYSYSDICSMNGIIDGLTDKKNFSFKIIPDMEDLDDEGIK